MPTRSAPIASATARRLHGEPDPALGGSAEAVVAQVGVLRQELVDEVAVGAVQLDPVETGVHRPPGGVREVLHGRLDLGGGQLHRDGEVLHAVRGEHLLRGPYGRGRDGERAGVVGVADPAGVHELGEDPAARRVDGVGHLAPARDLLVGVQPRRVHVALARRARLDPLRDDQAGRSALGVVEGGEGGGDPVHVGPGPGHGSHDQTAGELETTEFEGAERHGSSFLGRPTWPTNGQFYNLVGQYASGRLCPKGRRTWRSR